MRLLDQEAAMRVVLWDTRKLDVAKDFAGGFGVGQFPGHGGVLGRLIRCVYKRDRRPTALVFAYLAAIFRGLGHRVEYALDRVPKGADLYVFNPSLITLPLERQAMAQALAGTPGCRVLVVGAVAHSMPEAFDGLDVTICKGEAGAAVLEARRSAGQQRADRRPGQGRRPGPAAVSRLVAVCARTSSASATISRSFPRR